MWLMNIDRLEEWYEGLLEDVGKADNCVKVNKDIEQQLTGIPEALLYIWKKYGICSYGEGIWWHTNPRDFDDIVEMWLKGTDYWEPETNKYHVIGRTAFGELELWGEKSGRNLTINTLNGMIFPRPPYEKEIINGGANALIYSFIGGIDKDECDTYDQSSKHIFDRALKKLGLLKWDEMYTAVPMPIYSGGLTIENVQKEELFTQLALLRESIKAPKIMLNPMMQYD